MSTHSVDTVLIAGATGETGRAILELIAPRVETVRALTRSPDSRADLEAAGADGVFVVDLLDPTNLSAAVEGVDAVLNALGTAPRAVFSGPPYVDGAGTRALVDAAVAADVDAFVMVSALGVGIEPASALGKVFNVVVKPVQKAKAESEVAIREAQIRHTIFRPGILTNGPRTDAVTVAEPGAKLWGLVSRRDIARLVIAAPVTEEAENRTFEAVTTPRLSDRALDIEWSLPE